MSHRTLAAGLLALVLAATPAWADDLANRLFVEAIQALAALDETDDTRARLDLVERADALLGRILEQHAGSAAAARAVELLHPEAAARVANLDALRQELEALAAVDAQTLAEREQARDELEARIRAVPALGRLRACDDGAEVGCLRAAAAAKLDELGLLAPADPDQVAMLYALDLAERVAAGDDLAGATDGAADWSWSVAVFTAVDLWSQLRGVASLAPWQAVAPAVLPEELAGDLAPLLAYLAEREAEADRDLAEIRDGACRAGAEPDLALLAPVLCTEVVRIADFDRIWSDLPPFQRLGVLEVLSQAVRVDGLHEPWTSFLYGLERPADLAADEAPFLARALVAATLGWYLRP